MRAGAFLTLREGRRYILQDAARVLGRRNGETDPYGLTGKVESIRDFIKKGAIVTTDSIRVGPAIYDVDWGVIAFPAASADESGANPRMS